MTESTESPRTGGRGEEFARSAEGPSTGLLREYRDFLPRLGMLPLLFDAFFAAMAVTIIGGLLFATGLTMIVLPTLFAAFFGAHE